MLTGRAGNPGRIYGFPIVEGWMAQQGTARARAVRESPTAKLAKFFPEATPVHIPVSLTWGADKAAIRTETTIIEFGTPREVLFASTLPLEFADKLRVHNSDGSFDVEACVVALQYANERTAVAARFTQQVMNWIVKP
jgi:hypothetical protein